jgi:defect-in-organelle-trafficking protein DotC
MKAIRFIPLLILPFLASCGATGGAGTNSLAELKEIHSTGSISDNSSKVIRSQSLQDTALSVGAQAGLYYRALQINQILQQQSKALDEIFNFNRLMLSDHVLPPVLQTSAKNLKLDGADVLRLSDTMYLIRSQARFVTAAPNWRNYLLMNATPADIPPYNMLPKTRQERVIWREYVTLGWQQGIEQGDLMLKDNLARLKRDFEGMILYRQLLAKKMVSSPFVQTDNLGVTGGGESLRINDELMQIKALPQLQPDSKQWHSIAVPGETPIASTGDGSSE